MSAVLCALRDRAIREPGAPALCDEQGILACAEIVDRLEPLVRVLAGRGARVVALLAENSVSWALWDLAALQAGVTLVPLPGFFSDGQLQHILMDAGVDLLISDEPGRTASLLFGQAGAGPAEAIPVAGRDFRIHGLKPTVPIELPAGISKITYTSGTTGTPKGVLLGVDAMERVAASLVGAIGGGGQDRHLALLPLATLLENIGGLYSPLLAGACAVLYSQPHVGLRGASGVDPARMLAALIESDATTAILLPQMLQALVAARAAGGQRPERLRHLAVGGAPVSGRLIRAARDLGLPVFEGYGLSECASVVAVSRPGNDLPGSVGRPLPHVRLRIASDGEIWLGGALFAGYLHDPTPPGDEWPTGDLGYLDDEGYLYLTGRKKNMFITAFGRNVAPEWVEAELTAHPAIAQAAVFGEGRPFNIAVIVPRPGASGVDGVEAAIAAANSGLPDYAQVSGVVIADAPFTPANRQATANGRLRRDAIAQAYGGYIAACHCHHHALVDA